MADEPKDAPQQGPQEVPTKVIRVKVDTDDLSAEQLRFFEALGMEDVDNFGPELEPQGTFESLDEMLQKEQQEDEGLWFDWPAGGPDAQILLCHPENAVMAWSQCEREIRAKHKLDLDEPLTAPQLMEASARASFQRSVRGWKLVLKGQPLEFNRINFMRMWRRRRFRNFCTDKWRDFRRNPEALGEQAGKD